MNELTIDKINMLHFTCGKFNDLEMTTILIEAKIDVNQCTVKDKRTPLMETCRLNYQPIIKKLILSKADVNAQDINGLSALSIAQNCQHNHHLYNVANMINMLEDAGAHI